MGPDDTEPEPPINVCTQEEWQNFVDNDVELPTVEPATKNGIITEARQEIFLVQKPAEDNEVDDRDKEIAVRSRSEMLDTIRVL